MAYLNINPRELDRIADKLEDVADDVRAEKNTLGEVYATVNQSWKSQHTHSYLEELYEVERRIERLTEGINQIADCLRNTAEEARRIEEENRERMRD